MSEETHKAEVEGRIKARAFLHRLTLFFFCSCSMEFSFSPIAKLPYSLTSCSFIFTQFDKFHSFIPYLGFTLLDGSGE